MVHPPRSLLDSLTPRSREFVLHRSTVRRLVAGEHLFHHGDKADCMYVVETGRLAVQITTSDGERAIIRVIGPDQVVGELALVVDGLRRTGSVVALEASIVRVIHSALFAEIRTRDPGVDRALVADLAARLAALSEQFVVNQFGTLAERVAERLLVLDAVYRHGWIEVTQEALGAMTGGSRQAVNRILADAEAAGLLVLRRGGVKVLDPVGLATNAG
jgi:CRP/FNR family transcriptional regulator, cyclic AMP receptor protein